MSSTIDFLAAIWGSGTGYVQLVQRRMENGERTGDPTDEKWFQWPQEKDRIKRYISIRSDQEVWFTPIIYKTDKRSENEVAFLSAVYVDNDGVTGDFAIEPTFRVQSSPAHEHDYWVLDKPYNPREAVRPGFEISAKHRHDSANHQDLLDAERDNPLIKPHKFCGTDPGGWDLSQILRVPGTVNTKAEYGSGFKHAVTYSQSNVVYTLEQMKESYPDSGAKIEFNLPEDQIPVNAPEVTTLLDQLAGRSDLIRLFTQTPSESDSWSEILHAFLNGCFRAGFNAEEVFTLGQAAACNKFRRGIRNGNGTYSPRANPDLDLWRDVRKAYLVHREQTDYFAPDFKDNDYAVYSNRDMDEDTSTTVFRSMHQQFDFQLISPEEWEHSLSKITFIDEYVAWASSLTDASQKYHVASAFTILSVVFGEFGHVQPKFGKMRLNLWFLVLGLTTRSRKSTARRLMIRIIKGLTSTEYRYDEGADFTGEGLTDRLLQKNRRSTLVHRDEVQGLFRQTMSKNYMAGLNDTLTDLYDGDVSNKMRSGAKLDENNSGYAETNFILYMMGILTKVTSVLTVEDFQSGFLARFIHVIGEVQPRTKESEWLDQADEIEINQVDPGYMNIMRNLNLARTEWKKATPNYETIRIRVEPEAWKRWNQAKWDMQEAIEHHERKDVLEPGLDRLGFSSLKAAALIAMYDKRSIINMDDMLVALRYTQSWIEDMVQSSEMVAESFWKKDIGVLHEIIVKKNGRIKWEEAYSRMDKKPQEFNQLVEGMCLSGLARVETDVSTKGRTLVAL